MNLLVHFFELKGVKFGIFDHKGEQIREICSSEQIDEEIPEKDFLLNGFFRLDFEHVEYNLRLQVRWQSGEIRVIEKCKCGF